MKKKKSGKPKKRPADPNMRMESIMRDVIEITGRPITAPKTRQKE